jgi:uncharacterized membrane protein
MRRSQGWPVRLGVIILASIVIAGLGMANLRFSQEFPGGNDFLARWVGAHYWMQREISPYDGQVSLSAQELIYGRPAGPGEDVAHFVYPMPAMIFFAPFGLMDYTLARTVWMTILEIALPALALIGIAIAGWRPSRAMRVILLLFSVLWYHGLRAIVVGQFAVLESLLMIGALLAIQRRNDAVAGILLGLSIAKPQMPILLLPFVFLWSIRARRWSIPLWCGATILFLIIGFTILLPEWPVEWLRQVVEYPSYTELGPPVSIITSVIPRASGIAAVALGGVLLLYLLWEWTQALGKPDRWFQWTSAMTITVTNLVAIRTATTNYVVLLPVLILVFSTLRERWGEASRPAIFGIIAVLLIGLWWLFLSTVEGNVEGPAMYLPLPILAFTGLWWTRWWAVRSVPQ